MGLFGLLTSVDQRVQRLGGDDRATANARCPETTGCNVTVDRGPAKAGCVARFPNAVTDLRWIASDGLHNFWPHLARVDLRRASWDIQLCQFEFRQKTT